MVEHTGSNAIEERRQLYSLRAFLLNNLSRRYTLKELSRLCGISGGRLNEQFALMFGTGIFQFLYENRMKLARLLLLHTGKNIKEIACLTGYSTPQNFMTAYRRYWNETARYTQLHAEVKHD